MPTPSQQTDFVLTVCVTLMAHYSSDLLPMLPVLHEARVTVEADPRCDFMQSNGQATEELVFTEELYLGQSRCFSDIQVKSLS